MCGLQATHRQPKWNEWITSHDRQPLWDEWITNHRKTGGRGVPSEIAGLAGNPSVLESVFQARHANARRGFRNSATTPMRLQAHRIVIALTLKRPELPHPVDDAS